jgi:ankyrin repeat protein
MSFKAWDVHACCSHCRDSDACANTALLPSSHLQKHLQFLLESGANVTLTHSKGSTALVEAATNGTVGVMEVLLAAGADPSSRDLQGMTPIMFAANMGNSAACELLHSKVSKAVAALTALLQPHACSQRSVCGAEYQLNLSHAVGSSIYHNASLYGFVKHLATCCLVRVTAQVCARYIEHAMVM